MRGVRFLVVSVQSGVGRSGGVCGFVDIFGITEKDGATAFEFATAFEGAIAMTPIVVQRHDWWTSCCESGAGDNGAGRYQVEWIQNSSPDEGVETPEVHLMLLFGDNVFVHEIRGGGGEYETRQIGDETRDKT